MMTEVLMPQTFDPDLLESCNCPHNFAKLSRLTKGEIVHIPTLFLTHLPANSLPLHRIYQQKNLLNYFHQYDCII